MAARFRYLHLGGQALRNVRCAGDVQSCHLADVRNLARQPMVTSTDAYAGEVCAGVDDSRYPEPVDAPAPASRPPSSNDANNASSAVAKCRATALQCLPDCTHWYRSEFGPAAYMFDTRGLQSATMFIRAQWSS
jgi:hypothetical protein